MAAVKRFCVLPQNGHQQMHQLRGVASSRCQSAPSISPLRASWRDPLFARGFKCASAADQLVMGPVTKVTFLFREPFWQQRGAVRSIGPDQSLTEAVFFHEPTASFPTWWTTRPVQSSLLTAWSGGPKARALSGISQDAIVDSAVISLEKLFGRRRVRCAR